MARVDEVELRRWRQLPASELLSRFADYAKRDVTFVPVKSPETERWHAHVAGRHYEFLTEGPKFYDTRSQRGGGGAVDLMMYLFQLDFRAATEVLRRYGL